MTFQLPTLRKPDFSDAKFIDCENVTVKEVEKDGVAPTGFYLTSHMPTFYRVQDRWLLPRHSSLNCVAVLEGDQIIIRELRDLKVGDQVVVGRQKDCEKGIYVYRDGFDEEVYETPGKSVESSYTADYDFLFELMRYEREHGGKIVWVLGPSVVFDHDTRIGLSRLAKAGFVHALLGGNAMATHDLEGGYLNTALGQNIYTQESMPMGHYNHLDLLNEIRRAGSIQNFIDEGAVKDGFMKTVIEHNIPYVLAGSIRDDGPLPEVYHNVSDSLTAMKEVTDQATLIICLATMLHSVSAANLASSYTIREDGSITPVFMYSVDVTENVVNKVASARENVGVRTIVTNVQDFVVNLERELLNPEEQSEDIDGSDAKNEVMHQEKYEEKGHRRK